MADSRRHFTGLWLLAAASVLAAGALWLLREGDRPAEPAGGDIVRGAPETDAPPARVLPEPVDRPPPPAPEPEAPRTGTLTGRVVSPQRLARPGARVDAFRGASLGLPGLVKLKRLKLDARADAQGRFTLADVPAADDLVLRLDGGFAPTEIGPFALAAGEVLDLGDLVVQPGMIIAGRVQDEAGRAVSGARVGLLQGVIEEGPDGAPPEPSRLVLSDADGHFEIPDAAPQPFNLLASAKGFARARVADGPLPGEATTRRDVTITLRATRPLTGLVLADADDAPLAGARVVATAMDPGNDGAEALAGADGRFTFTDLAPGSYAFVASAKGFSSAHARTYPERPDAPLELRLRRQGRMTGVVLDPEGRPVKAFDLQAKHHLRKLDGAVPIGEFERITSGDGSFAVEGLEAGFACVDVWAKGYALTSSPCVKLLQGDEVEGLVVNLVRGASLTGLVVDDTGAPVAGATVSLHLNNEPEADFLRDDPRENPRLKSTRTDEDGRFLIEDLSEMTFQVEVDHPAHARLRKNGVQVAGAQGNDAGTLVVTRSATVRGAALDGSGNPLPGAEVALTLKLGPARKVRADGHGRYEFARVAPGEYSLECFARAPSLSESITSGLKQHQNTFAVAAGQVLELNVISGN